MALGSIKNNDTLIRRIKSFIIAGNISHAYIFVVDKVENKRLPAVGFAKAVLCVTAPGVGCDSCVTCRKIGNGNHEDVIYVERDENSIKDEAIEELQGKLKRKPYSGDRSIAIIEDAGTMTVRAQNRLLKTLEEPFPGTVIILLTDNLESLSTTILSRCVVLRWNPFSDEDFGELAGEAENILNLIFEGEPFYRSKARIMRLAENRDEAYNLLDAMEALCGRYVRERVYGTIVLKTAIGCIEEARRSLKRGMNIGYTLKNMILEMEDKA